MAKSQSASSMVAGRSVKVIESKTFGRARRNAARDVAMTIPLQLRRNSRLASRSSRGQPPLNFMKTILSAAMLLGVGTIALGQPALTIYNQNFAVVRERVPLDLKAGENAVTFVGATAQLEPDSVVLRDPTGKVQLRV